MAVIKLDNQTVAQTSWRPCSQQAWDQRYKLEHFQFKNFLLNSSFNYFFVRFL